MNNIYEILQLVRIIFFKEGEKERVIAENFQMDLMRSVEGGENKKIMLSVIGIDFYVSLLV